MRLQAAAGSCQQLVVRADGATRHMFGGCERVILRYVQGGEIMREQSGSCVISHFVCAAAAASELVVLASTVTLRSGRPVVLPSDCYGVMLLCVQGAVVHHHSASAT